MGSNAEDEATALASEPAPEAAPPPRRSARHRKALRWALGVILGLALTETIFRLKDGGAFPLVNVYVVDDRCGVRLDPGATARVGRPGERVTTVRINRDGFRGPDWTPPADDDVLVVGDSQSFGLGVEDVEAFPALLSKRLSTRSTNGGRRVSVLDASVPTYGPQEYAITVERVLSRRSPKTIVVSVNLLNDFFELDRPNVERHRAFEGWAVRVQSVPDLGEPSRTEEAVIRTSHAAFALWRWSKERRLASAAASAEPDFHALANLVTSTEQAGTDDASARETARQEAAAALRAEVDASNARVLELVRKYAYVIHYSGQYAAEWDAYLAGDGAPKDQVFTLAYGGCEARSGTYEAHFDGPHIQRDVESMLREIAILPGISKDESQRVFAALARRDAALAAAARPPEPTPLPPTAHPAQSMARWVGALAATLPRGTRLVVLPIPLDLEVSLGARHARGASDGEAAAIDRLVADLVHLAPSMGAIGVDPTDALRALGDSAYLPDGHLSREGHAAVADALASVISSAPLPMGTESP